MNEDTNTIIRAYLVAQTTLTDVVPAAQIESPRLSENTDRPALSFFTRGGSASPYIPGIVIPSVQFDCWADSPIEARAVYSALFAVLQGIQNIAVATAAGDFVLLGATEEVQGQDLTDEIQGYFRVLAFFAIMIRAEY